MRVKKLKLHAYIENRVKNGEDLSPTTIQEEYNKLTNQTKSLQSVSQMLQRMKLDANQRQNLIIQKAKQEAGKDILEYAEWINYKRVAEDGRVQVRRINRVAKVLREVWMWMGQTDPRTWQYIDLINKIEEHYPKYVNEQGQRVYQKHGAVKDHLGCINTVFKGIIPENFSAGLTRPAGALKDFLNFPEMDEYLNNLEDTESMSKEGWLALSTVWVNMGCREGTLGNTGIVGLLWEDINFVTMRCSIREKGHRGHAGERWDNVPLNMFKWLYGAERLTAWWERQGKPVSGKVFPITYKMLCDQFDRTRHRCQSRIKIDDEAMRPHTFGRRTHVMYARRIGIPLEQICGIAPNGRFGVGWKSSSILVNHYLSEEGEEIDPQELAFMQARPEYSKVLASMQEQNRKIKELLGAF
jgi:hypothetical protein